MKLTPENYAIELAQRLFEALAGPTRRTRLNLTPSELAAALTSAIEGYTALRKEITSQDDDLSARHKFFIANH